MREARDAAWRQVASVETPEHVTLDYEVAGIGSRSLAAIIDHGILVAIELALVFFPPLVGLDVGTSGTAALLLLFVALPLLYFVLFEGLRDGQTPGKRRLGIRVVGASGHAVTFGAAFVRGVMRIVDFLPFGYLLGGLAAGLSTRGQRLGDLAAGTLVVRDAPAVAAAPPAAPARERAAAAGFRLPQLDDETWALLDRFVARQGALEPAVRATIATDLLARVGARMAVRDGAALETLLEVHAEEAARREGRTAGVGGGGDARSAARRDAFRQLATRVAAGGLDVLGAEELTAFAAMYREIAADLARGRTAGWPARELADLERLAAAGHNALYREERRPWRRAVQVLFRDCPGAVVAAWRPVALAGALFIAPAMVGFGVLRQQPALAESVVPESMLRRAEAASRGEAYFTARGEVRPVIASAITANNIRVAFTAFAGGALFGVGSLVLVAFNGLSIGMAFGHFANAGLGTALLAFVLGHGVLELFAIFVAGAAGFLLGSALLLPGRLRRADALAAAGQRAMLLLGAVVTLLVVAGLIEGFVSTGGGSVGEQAVVAGTSFLGLVGYLWGGGRAERRKGGR